MTFPIDVPMSVTVLSTPQRNHLTRADANLPIIALARGECHGLSVSLTMMSLDALLIGSDEKLWLVEVGNLAKYPLT